MKCDICGKTVPADLGRSLCHKCLMGGKHKHFPEDIADAAAHATPDAKPETIDQDDES